MNLVWIVVTAGVLAQHSMAQHQQHQQHQQGGHYAGLESRDLKALSEDEIRGLEQGEGMSLALVAELNHYPGPKHVLELRDELGLTDAQAERAQEIFDRMHAEAARIGGAVLAKERELETDFRSGEVRQEKAGDTVVEVGRLRGELRWAHLKAHVEMNEVLTEAQRKRYDELRGYGAEP